MEGQGGSAGVPCSEMWDRAMRHWCISLKVYKAIWQQLMLLQLYCTHVFPGGYLLHNIFILVSENIEVFI